jgi:serpin B
MKPVYRIAIHVVIVVNLLNQWVSADETLDAVVSGNTHFAFELYATLKTDEGNLFLSPYSISTALAMTYAGARHNTAEQMAQVLHFTPQPAQFHPAMGQLQQQINATSNDITLNVANSLWIEKNYPILEDFLEIVKNHYSAELNSIEFQRVVEAADVINAWVEEKTHNKIQDIITPEQLKSAALVLVNAIYFKGNWAYQFDKQKTRNEPFWLTPAIQIEVPMMAQYDRQFNYMQNDVVEVLELPYEGKDISMIILLPRKRHGLAELENILSTEKYTEWLSQLRQQEIIVLLPKFQLEKQLKLSQTLAAMGMPDAFSDGIADFSGIDGSNKLVISGIVHKAFVEVNEEGTEAAAATGGIITPTSLPPTFHADHPFLFLIRHRPSESILFLGRVVNPLTESSQSSEAEVILSPEFQLYIPKLRYQSASGETMPLWANLKLVPAADDKLLFEVVDYGVLESQ